MTTQTRQSSPVLPDAAHARLEAAEAARAALLDLMAAGQPVKAAVLVEADAEERVARLLVDHTKRTAVKAAEAARVEALTAVRHNAADGTLARSADMVVSLFDEAVEALTRLYDAHATHTVEVSRLATAAATLTIPGDDDGVVVGLSEVAVDGIALRTAPIASAGLLANAAEEALRRSTGGRFSDQAALGLAAVSGAHPTIGRVRADAAALAPPKGSSA